jgi:hypothetical protein
MVVDELEARSAEISAGPVVNLRRAGQVLAVGVTWAMPGALVGLLVAAAAAYWADLALRFSLIGTLFGAAAGVWLEVDSGPHEPSPQ